MTECLASIDTTVTPEFYPSDFNLSRVACNPKFFGTIPGTELHSALSTTDWNEFVPSRSVKQFGIIEQFCLHDLPTDRVASKIEAPMNLTSSNLIVIRGDSGSEQIASQIERLTIPERWRDEGVLPPTMECRRKTKMFANHVRITYGLYPDKMVPSKVGGIYVLYRHVYSDRCLGLEIDNDLDCISQVFDRTRIFQTTDVELGDESLDLAFEFFND